MFNLFQTYSHPFVFLSWTNFSTVRISTTRQPSGKRVAPFVHRKLCLGLQLGLFCWVQPLGYSCRYQPPGFLGYAAPIAMVVDPLFSVELQTQVEGKVAGFNQPKMWVQPTKMWDLGSQTSGILIAERLVASAEITNCLYTFIVFCQDITWSEAILFFFVVHTQAFSIGNTERRVVGSQKAIFSPHTLHGLKQYWPFAVHTQTFSRGNRA